MLALIHFQTELSYLYKSCQSIILAYFEEEMHPTDLFLDACNHKGATGIM